MSLQDYKTKYKYCVKLENEKTSILQKKNKILDQLIQDEKVILKANTDKRVFDITKTFCKKLDQTKISQGIDKKRGIIDLSSTKLFNTTFNSVRYNGIERTFGSVEKNKTKGIIRKSSGKMSVSHHSSNFKK